MTSFFILLGLVILFTPWTSLLENEIKSQFKNKDIHVTSINITKLGHKGVSIKRLNINDGAIIFDSLNIKTSLDSLLNKSIEKIVIQGLVIQKEKLLKILKHQKNKTVKNSSKGSNQNIEQLIDSIPSDEISFSLNSINGLDKEIDAGRFPIHFSFNKAQKKITLKINEGHIKSFKKFKNIKVSFDSTLSFEKNHIDIKIKTFDIDLEDKEVKFIFKETVSIDLNKDNSFSLTAMVLPFQMNVKFSDAKPAITELLTLNKVVLKEGKYNLISKIRHPNKTLNANIDGWIDQNNIEVGKVDFNLVIDNLIRENLKETSPLLSTFIKELEGKLIVEGSILFKENTIRPDISIVGKNLSFQYEESKITKLNIKHHLSSFKTYGSQKLNFISIDELDIGLKINNFKTKYTFLNTEKIQVKSISLNTYEGNVLAKDFSIINNRPQDLEVELKKFPLNKFLNMALKDGIVATGLIEGTLPIAYINNRPVIKNGRLKNSGKGTVKYNPEGVNPLKSMNKMQVNMLLNYLKDFSYNQLSIDADSDEEYNLTLNSKFKGTNPTAYNGRPLSLGVNLDFNIKDAINSSLIFMKIPEKIEKRLIKEMKK